MVVVSIKKEKEKISFISISGHACFAQHGEDIVCAGISSIIFGGMNALVEFGLNQKKIEVDNEIKFNLNETNEILNTVAETIIIQLETIQESYPDYLDITY